MTDSDAKEWVTIGIPEEERDKAQERPETYGDIMSAGVEALANGAEGAPELDEMQDLPADEIADRVADQISMANEPGVEVDTKELIREIRKLQELVEQAPSRTADKFEEKYR